MNNQKERGGLVSVRVLLPVQSGSAMEREMEMTGRRSHLYARTSVMVGRNAVSMIRPRTSGFNYTDYETGEDRSMKPGETVELVVGAGSTGSSYVALTCDVYKAFPEARISLPKCPPSESRPASDGGTGIAYGETAMPGLAEFDHSALRGSYAGVGTRVEESNAGVRTVIEEPGHSYSFTIQP